MLNKSLGGYKFTTKDGKIAYYKESEGADSAVPFSSVNSMGAGKYLLSLNWSNPITISDYTLGVEVPAKANYICALFNTSNLKNFTVQLYSTASERQNTFINAISNDSFTKLTLDTMIDSLNYKTTVASADYVLFIHNSAGSQANLKITINQ